MLGRLSFGVVSAIALTLVAVPITIEGQEGAAPLANARLSHVAVATSDLERTAKAFAGVLGVAAPAARSVTLEAPGNRTVQQSIAFFNTANFQIELDQPLGPGPAREFIDRFGIGMQHIGFAVNGPIEGRVQEMERRGGRLVMGSATGRFAFLTFADLGLTIELVRDSPASAAAPAGDGPTPLASRQLSHIGLVYRDGQPAVNAIAGLLGIAAPTMSTFKGIDYMPGVKADPGAHVKFAQLPAGGVNIEVVEPVGGPSPWTEFLDMRTGTSPAHHIAFGVGPQNDFDSAVRDLKTRGGVWKKGKRGFEGANTGSSPEFEFLDTLGLVVEVSLSAR